MPEPHVWTLPSGLVAARTARGYVADICRDLPPQDLETAQLLATELVSNAVLHGCAPIQFFLARVGHTLELSVFDRARQPPMLQPPSTAAGHGRGLRIVDALAEDWGTDVRADGKRVWVTLDVGRDERPSQGTPHQ